MFQQFILYELNRLQKMIKLMDNINHISIPVTAYGVFRYISDGFNVFDGVIVILSSFEIYTGLVHGIAAEGSGLSVLRTFRLLRILKLVRFLPNLRRQLVVMLRTMDNVAVFFGLLMLFIFIFRYFHSIIPYYLIILNLIVLFNSLMVNICYFLTVFLE